MTDVRFILYFRWKPNFVIYHIKKHISIKILKEALGVKDDAEGAEYDDLEEANIGKMDELFEPESETSDKEAENYMCYLPENVHW